MATGDGDAGDGGPGSGDAERCEAGTGRRAPPGRRQKGPFVDHCPAGKYAWCRCGNSATYPYCDGTHRGTDVTPLKVVFERPCTVVWCACGASGNKPFCDGSHSCL